MMTIIMDRHKLGVILSTPADAGLILNSTLKTPVIEKPVTDDYDVHDIIARGRFAVVRKCRHRASGREFAAKYLRKRRMGKNMRNEIIHEVAVLEHAGEHTHIVNLFEVFETSQEMILVLELVPGGELYKFCNSELLAEPHMIRVMRQVLQAVEFLHNMNIVHLDLKPSNILLTDESAELTNVKLCDFGISRRLSAGIEVRDIVGTPDYVAPEVLNYDPIGTAADMWSVGVLAYVLATGHSPFAGDTKLETIQNISQHSQVDFPDELFEDFDNPAPIIDFIRQLLVKDPKQRPTATACLQHVWLQATPSPPVAAVAVDSAADSTTIFADDTAKSFAVAEICSHHVLELNGKENYNQNSSVDTNANVANEVASSSPTKILRTHSPTAPATPNNISSPRTVRAHSDNGQRSPSSTAVAVASSISLMSSSATFHTDDEAVEQQRLEATMLLNAQQKARMAAAAMTTVSSCPSSLDVPSAVVTDDVSATTSPTIADIASIITLPTPPSSTKTIFSSASTCSSSNNDSVAAAAESAKLQQQKICVTSFPATPTKPVVTKSFQLDVEKTLMQTKPVGTKRSKSTLAIAHSTTTRGSDRNLVVNLFINKQQQTPARGSSATVLPDNVVGSRRSYTAAVNSQSVLPLDVDAKQKPEPEIKTRRKSLTKSDSVSSTASCSPMVIHSMPCSPLRPFSSSSVLPSLRGLALNRTTATDNQQQATPTKPRKVSKTSSSRAALPPPASSSDVSSVEASASTSAVVAEQQHRNQLHDSDYSSKSSCASSSSPQCNSRADSPASPPQQNATVVGAAVAQQQRNVSDKTAVVNSAPKPGASSSSSSSSSDDSSGIKITAPTSSSAVPSVSASFTAFSYRKHNATTTPAVVAVKRATMKSSSTIHGKTVAVPVEIEANVVVPAEPRRQTFAALPSTAAASLQPNWSTEDERVRSQHERSSSSHGESPARQSVLDITIKHASASTAVATSSSLPLCHCIVGSVSSQFGPCLHMRAAAAASAQQQQHPPRSSSSAVSCVPASSFNNTNEFRRSWAAASNSSPLFFDSDAQSNNNDDTVCCNNTNRSSGGGPGARFLAQQWLTAVAAARQQQQQQQPSSPAVTTAATSIPPRPRTSSCMNTKSDTVLMMNRSQQQRRSLYSDSQHHQQQRNDEQNQKSATLPPTLSASSVRSSALASLAHEIRRVSSSSLHVCDAVALSGELPAVNSNDFHCCRCFSASSDAPGTVGVSETPPPTHLMDHNQQQRRRNFPSSGASSVYCVACSCEPNGNESKRNSGEFSSSSSSSAAAVASAVLHGRQHSHGNDSNSSSGLGLMVAPATPRSSLMLLDTIDDVPANDAEKSATKHNNNGSVCCKRCLKKLRKMSNCSLATTLSSSSSSNTSDLDVVETQRGGAVAAVPFSRHNENCSTSQLVMKRCRHFEAAAAASAAGAHAETLRTRRDAANDVVVQLENTGKS